MAYILLSNNIATGYKFQNARVFHATSDIYPERDWLVDPYVATPPRNKLNNRSNGKEVLLKKEKTVNSDDL